MGNGSANMSNYHNCGAKIGIKRCDNTTGIAGVGWCNTFKKWYVRIGNKRLGYYKDFFEACCARKSKENSYDT